MLLELIGFFGFFILVLAGLAEVGKGKPAGILAGVLLIILGAYIFLDGVQIRTGELSTSSQNLTLSSYSCIDNVTECTEGTDTSTGTISTTTTYSYADIPITPYIGLAELLGIIFTLTGLYAIFHYLYGQ
jgi:hypothetical protein